MVDLTHTDIATQEDKLYGIDHWANLFKATTWEELKMLANDNQFLQDASSTEVLIASKDSEIIRLKEELARLRANS